jgi:hypothetical protein
MLGKVTNKKIMQLKTQNIINKTNTLLKKDGISLINPKNVKENAHKKTAKIY